MTDILGLFKGRSNSFGGRFGNITAVIALLDLLIHFGAITVMSPKDIISIEIHPVLQIFIIFCPLISLMMYFDAFTDRKSYDNVEQLFNATRTFITLAFINALFNFLLHCGYISVRTVFYDIGNGDLCANLSEGFLNFVMYVNYCFLFAIWFVDFKIGGTDECPIKPTYNTFVFEFISSLSDMQEYMVTKVIKNCLLEEQDQKLEKNIYIHLSGNRLSIGLLEGECSIYSLDKYVRSVINEFSNIELEYNLYVKKNKYTQSIFSRDGKGALGPNVLRVLQ